MNTLDYQDPRRARAERASNWRRSLFGVSQAEVWDALAREIGARHDERGWFQGGRVVARVGPWLLTLDEHSDGEGNVSTRLRAPFVSRDGFRFRIYRKSVFSGLGKLLGMQDVEIGDPAFDDAFIIQSAPPTRVKRLLENDRLRRLMHAQPRILLEVRDDDGWFGRAMPAGVDELYFQANGRIKDLDRLRALFDLFAETLRQLTSIGTASDQPPGVIL